MKTNRLSLIFGVITVAIHFAGFAAVDLGAQKLLAQTVSYHDLDLSRPADAAVLYKRIGAAAAEVCERFDAGAASHQALREKCAERAIAASVARVNDANLSARHDAGFKVRTAAQS
jgi:UrcA family protein